MSDVKAKIKSGIDDTAAKAKKVAGTAVDKTKDAARSAGQSIKNAGDRVKDAGK